MTDVALDLLPGPTGAWTVADLMRLPDDGSRQEIIDGSLLVTPPPSVGHQHVAMRLVRLLNEAASSDWVALEGVGVALRPEPSTRLLIPDVVIATRSAVARGGALLDPADVRLVVEIGSPSSRSIDRLTKPALYAEAGIGAFWRVETHDPVGPVIVVHHLTGQAYTVVAELRGGDAGRLEVPFPLTVDPATLVAD